MAYVDCASAVKDALLITHVLPQPLDTVICWINTSQVQ